MAENDGIHDNFEAQIAELHKRLETTNAQKEDYEFTLKNIANTEGTTIDAAKEVAKNILEKHDVT